MPANNVPRKKVAVVGSGCSGIAALWVLNRTHHDVHLYEAAGRLGGHTNTVDWCHGKYTTKVDTGFIVMNSVTYPNFLSFLRKMGVAAVPTPMTFSVCRDKGVFEWSGTGLDGLFCQRRNLFSPRMWRMVFDILRFNQFALDLLEDEELDDVASPGESIGHYLDRQGYSDAFRDDYLLPMTAAVWSTSPDSCSLEFPAVTLVRFLWNHHLLSTVARRPGWLTIDSGSQSYVDAVMKGFPADHVFLNTPVRSASNEPDGRVRLHLDGGRSAMYDHVILATHGDEAFDIVKSSATAEETEVLSCFQTSQNEAVLHSDPSLLPSSRKAWASWNYLSQSSRSPGSRNTRLDRVSLTYNMNILQHIPPHVFGNVLVTLNPLTEPDPGTVQGRYKYTHPLYTAAAVRAQRLLPRIQNQRGISYAGAWTKYGFHEDGFSSGLAVATQHLGAELPFDFVDSTFSRGRAPELGVADWLLRMLLWVIQVCLVEPGERRFGVSRTPPRPTPSKTESTGGSRTNMGTQATKGDSFLPPKTEKNGPVVAGNAGWRI